MDMHVGLYVLADLAERADGVLTCARSFRTNSTSTSGILTGLENQYGFAGVRKNLLPPVRDVLGMVQSSVKPPRMLVPVITSSNGSTSCFEDFGVYLQRISNLQRDNAKENVTALSLANEIGTRAISEDVEEVSNNARKGEFVETATGKLIQCGTCKAVFKRRTYLKKHINAVHLKIKPFKCPSCDRCFGYKGARAKHIRTIHQGLKPFPCVAPGCGMRFSEKGNMNKHFANKHAS